MYKEGIHFMDYRTILQEENDAVRERLDLSMERVAAMGEDDIRQPYGNYFRCVSRFILMIGELVKEREEGKKLSLSQLQERNHRLYEDILPEHYEESFANPDYAVKELGEGYGQILSALYTEIRGDIVYAFEMRLENITILNEVFLEVYNLFVQVWEEGTDQPKEQQIKDAFYWYVSDYSDLLLPWRIREGLDPKLSFAKDIIMESDLNDLSYLYEFGEYISESELKLAAFMNTLPQETVDKMADTYTEGYRIGFITFNKDISKKSVVQVLYPLGFERMIRAALKNFEKMGMKPAMRPFSTSVNKQFDYDHKEDMALWLDKAYVEYRLECMHNALERMKDVACKCGGPAVIEIFGEEPFAPVSKKEAAHFNDEQQKLAVHMTSVRSQYMNSYIHSEDRSFTIIAYPCAAIGPDYKEIFTETVKINTLDYALYRDMQQKIIDVLDTADRVHIVGTNGNRTDLYVKIHELKEPSKETAFENCVADVNIPVGEVFTSPVLEGTNGKLHVSQVYLNELNFLNLEIDFKDGMIDKYTCTNFEDEEENRKYISDNVLFHHDTLPMGEFAIGTNTTAYRMARVYDIAAKMPILIAEKTGPHFAVGDTCYTYDEDNMTYNPDGKAIIARDNSVSIRRKEDISKAYFNCHTDITIPYDELGAITVIRHDGSTCDIIRDGRFVLEGVEELNKPLDTLDAESK